LVALNVAFGLFVLPESLPADRRRPFSLNGAQPFAALMRLPAGSTIRGLAATLFLLQLTRVMAQSNWVLFTQLQFSWTARAVGLSLGVWGLNSLIIMAWLVRIALPRLGERRTTFLGLALIALGCVLYGSATQGWQMYAIMLTTSVGFMAQPALQGMISRQVAPTRQGEMQGALTSLYSLALIAGPIIANGTFSYFTGPATTHIPGIAFYIAGVFILTAILFAAGTLVGMRPPVAVAPVASKTES
jgi:DHA1 family tetracycline resistance protein-like MFS transporter